MPKPVWESDYYSPEICDLGLDYLIQLHEMELDYETSVRLLGYWMHMRRNKGACFGGRFKTVLEGAQKSKFRFAKGKYGPFYQQAGEKLLMCICLFIVKSVDPETPPQIIWDWIKDNKEKAEHDQENSHHLPTEEEEDEDYKLECELDAQDQAEWEDEQDIQNEYSSEDLYSKD